MLYLCVPQKIFPKAESLTGDMGRLQMKGGSGTKAPPLKYTFIEFKIWKKFLGIIFGIYNQIAYICIYNLIYNMKILTEGHKYELSMFEASENVQTIQFIEKVPKEEGSTELITINNGTTNEEVLSILIDRMQYLQSKFPCRENAIVITKLEESLMWLNKRTSDRLKRGVEGKQIK